MIVERIGAGGLSTDRPGSGQLGPTQLSGGQLSGGQLMAACVDGAAVTRRSAARWPLAQRAGDKPLRIVAAGRLVAEPQLDGGAVAQYQAAGAGSLSAPVPGLGESGLVPGSDGSVMGPDPDAATNDAAATRDGARTSDAAATRDAPGAVDAAPSPDAGERNGAVDADPAAQARLLATAGRGLATGAARRATAAVAGRRGRRPVRLTRRGRLVVLALLVLLLGALAALVAIPSQAAAPAGPARVVVVQPGDSLWSIVERYRPGADPVRAMDELVAANDLSGSTVYPGEELVLPTQW